MFARGRMRSLQSALFQRSKLAAAGPLNEQHYGEPVSSSTSVAASTTHQAADLGAQRIVTLRVFDGNIHRLGLLALCEAAVAIVGLYQLRHRTRFTSVFVRLLIAMAVAQVALGLLFYAAPTLDVGRGVMGLTGAFTLAGLAITRFAFLRMVDEEFFKRRVLVWGAGARARAIGKRLRRRTDQRGFRIVGYVRAPGDGGDVPKAPMFRANTGLVRLALRNRIEEIVVAMDDRRQ